jgi:hypothetical protein
MKSLFAIEVLTMDEKKSLLVTLIQKENISATVTLSEKLGVEPNVVVSMINDLLVTGELIGSLTEDSSRFYKSSVKISTAPTIPREEKLPKFLSYDTKPGKVITVIGFFILAGGVIINALATDVTEQNYAAILILIGLFVFLLGLYLVARRGAPD